MMSYVLTVLFQLKNCLQDLALKYILRKMSQDIFYTYNPFSLKIHLCFQVGIQCSLQLEKKEVNKGIQLMSLKKLQI